MWAENGAQGRHLTQPSLPCCCMHTVSTCTVDTSYKRARSMGANRFVSVTWVALEMAKVAVTWDRPGSRYHGVTHLVSSELVTVEEGRKVVVMWPRKGKPAEHWEGTVSEAEGTPLVKTVIISIGTCALCRLSGTSDTEHGTATQRT